MVIWIPIAVILLPAHPASFAVLEIRVKQLPTCPPRVEFAGGKLSVSEGCPLDNLKLVGGCCVLGHLALIPVA